MFFHAPHDAEYNDVPYDTFKITYSIDAISSSLKSNLSDVTIESNIGAENVMVDIINNGDQTGDFTQLSVIFYKNGIPVGYTYHYADVQNPGSEDFIEFSFPYDSNYDTIEVDDYEVYINSSYYYTW